MKQPEKTKTNKENTSKTESMENVNMIDKSLIYTQSVVENVRNARIVALFVSLVDAGLSSVLFKDSYKCGSPDT